MYLSKFLAIFLCCINILVKCKSMSGYHDLVGIPRAISLRLSERLRIVGGSQVAAISSLPYQAGILATLTTGHTSICGGSLISNTRVLTAAHCWWDGHFQAQKFTIVLGSLKIFSGGTRLETKDVVVHPSWNTRDILNDVAMVKIPRVVFNKNIQSISLPTKEMNQNFAGLTATASGYGKTSDTQSSFPTTTSLHQIQLTVMNNTECQKNFKVTIHNSHLCTDGIRGVGTCDGDSGGPLSLVWNQRRILVGIVSFGLGDGCQKGLPSVYTRVTAFLTWINANL
ncbi:unnamed protein product [Parnassius mnemosyne]|uniref:Peptidase S1 domain-containing protein n=1 Tax=Parnassius mnemosyne TaxID=213953 RepID=A0AAV1KHB4_9NEOP